MDYWLCELFVVFQVERTAIQENTSQQHVGVAVDVVHGTRKLVRRP